MTTLPTTFELVAVYQVRENYAFTEAGDVDGENPYWKYKGGTEYVVKGDLTIDDVAEMGQSGGSALVDDFSGYCWDDYIRENLITWTYEERSEAVLARVLTFVAHLRRSHRGGRLGDWRRERAYIIYSSEDAGMADRTMEWALDILIERGDLVQDARMEKPSMR